MQGKISKRSGLEPLANTIRQVRQQKGWSQRELSARAHVPQAQISRFETGSVDPQVSTLIELARTLDLELTLIPRAAAIAVGAAVRSAEERSEQRAAQALLDKLRNAAALAYDSAPEREEIISIQNSLRQLEPMAARIRSLKLEPELQRLLLNLDAFVTYPPAQRGRHANVLIDAAAWLRNLRNQLAHAVSEERPAYSLDDEDER
jgi:transcriptional regulator with XRE-family HTH domain